MLQQNHQAYRALWGVAGAIVAAGWAVYGIVWSNSNIFLAVMVAVTIVAYGSLAAFMRLRRGA